MGTTAGLSKIRDTLKQSPLEEMDTTAGLSKIRDTLKLKPLTQIAMLGRTAVGKDESIWFSTIKESEEISLCITLKHQ